MLLSTDPSLESISRTLNLTGQLLSEEIGLLTALDTPLHLDGNQISGELPTTMINLPLTIFAIDDNNLTGQFDPGIPPVTFDPDSAIAR